MNEVTDKATPLAIKRNMDEMNRIRLDTMVHSFFERWQPDDPRDAAEFSAGLFSLVRQIHIDASRPVQEHLAAIASYLPFQGGLK